MGDAMGRLNRQVLMNFDNWILASLGTIALLAFVQTFRFHPSAGLFPRIVSAVVALLCYYKLGGNALNASDSQSLAVGESEKPIAGLAWYWAFPITMLYSLLIFLIGFLWSTTIFLIIFPLFSGYRRWGILLIVVILTGIFLKVGMEMLLYFELPGGIILNQ